MANTSSRSSAVASWKKLGLSNDDVCSWNEFNFLLFIFIFFFFLCCVLSCALASGRHKQNNKPQAWGWHFSLSYSSYLPACQLPFPPVFLLGFSPRIAARKIVETFDNYIWRLLLWQLSQVKNKNKKHKEQKLLSKVAEQKPTIQGIRRVGFVVLRCSRHIFLKYRP